MRSCRGEVVNQISTPCAMLIELINKSTATPRQCVTPADENVSHYGLAERNTTSRTDE